jgi:hypothetical protein
MLSAQGKPLTVLHVFHHSIVVVMAWLWLEAAQSLQQLALLVNTGVHVVMYYYYFLCCLGAPPKWKRLVTNIQILQFVSRYALVVWKPWVWRTLQMLVSLIHKSLAVPVTCTGSPSSRSYDWHNKIASSRGGVRWTRLREVGR